VLIKVDLVARGGRATTTRTTRHHGCQPACPSSAVPHAQHGAQLRTAPTTVSLVLQECAHLSFSIATCNSFFSVAAALCWLEAALATTVCARMAWHHRCSEASCRAFARTGGDMYTDTWLRQQLCAQAAPSCPRGACGGSILLGMSKQGNKIFSAMTAPIYCDWPEREKEQRCPRQQRAPSA
jgi:hypothetical protein